MKQIAVLVGNRSGVIADLTALLAERGVNLTDIDTDGSDEHGVVHLSVDRYDDALAALAAAGYRAISEDAIVIRLHDEPGALANIALRFKAADINIRSMHILSREQEHVLVSIVSERREEALRLVADVRVG